MSFCRILSTLCSQVVFQLFTISRIYLADGKRPGQKVHRKVVVAVQNVKPLLLFVPLFRNNMRQRVIITINALLILKMLDIIIKCGIRDGEIVGGEIAEGGCE